MHQQVQRAGVELGRRAAKPRGAPGQKMIDQFGQVLAALAKRRHGDRHHRQAVVEVFAEAALGHLPVQAPVGRRQHPHVDRNRLARADAFERPLLQHAQQLGLKRGVDLGHFVEQDRTAVGQFEPADPRRFRAGEGAPLVAEQLALHQLGGEHRAVQAHQGLKGSAALGVDRPGDELLAGAALALDEDGFRRRGHAADLLAQTLHRRARTDHLGRLRAGLPRGGRFAHQAAVPDGLADQRFNLVGAERLLDVVERAVAHRLDRRGDRGVGRHHHDLRPVTPPLELDDQLQAGHPRHLHVGDNAIERHAGDPLEGLRPARAAAHFVTGALEDVGDRFSGLLVVVDHQHAPPEAILVRAGACWRHCSASLVGWGISKVNAAPRSGALLTETDPP